MLCKGWWKSGFITSSIDLVPLDQNEELQIEASSSSWRPCYWTGLQPLSLSLPLSLSPQPAYQTPRHTGEQDCGIVSATALFQQSSTSALESMFILLDKAIVEHKRPPIKKETTLLMTTLPPLLMKDKQGSFHWLFTRILCGLVVGAGTSDCMDFYSSSSMISLQQ